MPTKQLSLNEQIRNIDIKPLPKPQEEETAMVLSMVGLGAAVAGTIAFFTLRRLKENGRNSTRQSHNT
jgi:hypothetical protein